MQTKTKDNAITLAQGYANANEVLVLIYEIKNGMHQVTHYEYYPDGASELRLFKRDSDIVIQPDEKPEFPFGEFDDGKHWNEMAVDPYVD